MIVFLFILAVLFVAGYFFIQQPKFGRQPSGERLEKIKKSPHYKNGKFSNQSFTPDLTEGYSYTSVLYEFLFAERPRRIPVDSIPGIKTNLHNLPEDQNILVWFGHSSYFMQIDGKKILVDPVLSGSASPVSFTTKAFPGADRYKTEDIPEIDYLFISHDHWDHIDYETILSLQPKVNKIITGLGTGEHFEYWGFDPKIIMERDWYEDIELDPGFTAHTVPARHFSGRGFSRNGALWTSFVFRSPSQQVFIGGDSGYDKHFLEAGKKFGPFDLVILENGQYDKKWKYIHMMPEEVIQAAHELKARRLFPIHSAKFALANHAWDEPLDRIYELPRDQDLLLLTPVIGEVVNLSDTVVTTKPWWKGMQ